MEAETGEAMGAAVEGMEVERGELVEAVARKAEVEEVVVGMEMMVAMAVEVDLRMVDGQSGVAGQMAEQGAAWAGGGPA